MLINKIMKDKSKKNNRGFTLLEAIVSIGLFTVIMSMGISALLVIIDANAKAQSIKTAVNNINFSVDTVTQAYQTAKDEKTKHITCLNSSGDSEACSTNGNMGITFDRDVVIGGLPVSVKYKIFKNADNKLRIKIGSDPETDLLPAGVVLNSSNPFYVIQRLNSGLYKRSLVTVVLGGAVTSKSSKTSFSLQTSMSKLGQ